MKAKFPTYITVMLLIFGGITLQAQTEKPKTAPIVIDKTTAISPDTPMSKNLTNLLSKNRAVNKEVRVIDASNAIPQSDPLYDKLFVNRATKEKAKVFDKSNANSKGILERIKLYGVQQKHN